MGCLESITIPAHTIVLFKFGKEPVPEKIIEAIESLRVIPGILDLSHGSNFSETAAGYTYGITIQFENRDLAKEFTEHKVHLKVAKQIGKYLKKIKPEEPNNMLVIDIESDRYDGVSVGKDSEFSTTHIVLLSTKGTEDPELLLNGMKKLSQIIGVCDVQFGKSYTIELCRYFTHALIVRFVDKSVIEHYYKSNILDEIVGYIEKFLVDEVEIVNFSGKKIVVDYDSVRK